MAVLTCLRRITLVLVVAALGACGGGGGSSGTSTNSSNSVTLSQTAINWEQFQSQSGQYSPKTFTIRVTFHGAGVVIGYPPGFSPPSWLSTGDPVPVAPEQFDFSITLRPAANSQGQYSTTLRFVTGNADGSQGAYQDLSIAMSFIPLPAVYSGSVSFNSVSTDVAVPLTQTLSLNLAGTWTAQLENLNTGLTGWVTLTPGGASDQLAVGIPGIPRVGQYRGNILIGFDQNGITGQYRIPLTYTIAAGAPEPRFVAPVAGYLGEPGTLTIRGVGFDTATVQDVRIDGVSVASFSVINATEIRAQHGAFGATGAKSVEIVTASQTYRCGMDYLIKQRPTARAGDFTFPADFNHMVFDSTRDVLLVSTASTLYRLKLDANGWSIETQRDVAWFFFDMTPDAKYLVSVNGDSATLLDAVTLADVDAYAIPFSDTPIIGTTFGNLQHMMNNGSALLVVASPNFVVFDYVNKTFRRTTQPRNAALTRITQDRSKILVVPNTLTDGATFTGYFDSTIDDFAPINQTIGYGANRIAYSGDGERLLLDNDSVMDKNFTQLGVLAFDGNISNYSLELSANGQTGFKVEAGSGRIYKYDLSAPTPYPGAGFITFSPAFTYYAAFPATLVTPDGSMMMLGGGYANGSNKERRLVIVLL